VSLILRRNAFSTRSALLTIRYWSRRVTPNILLHRAWSLVCHCHVWTG